jgi:hypothetical protein
MVVLRWIILPLVAVHITLASWAGYRAIVQVFSLDLVVASPVLHGGSTVGYRVISSGRVPVTVRLELIQAAHAETLSVKRVQTSFEPAYDPIPKRGSQSIALGPEQLARFASGPAIVRATAIGSPQWLRTPPPTVREVPVTIDLAPVR